tara:strand:+ start:358 stop:759 length:402 start_codon:yes stop_codon:yes gene_type:complete
MNVFENIIDWNKERGLLEKGFNHKKETSFILEELLESTGKYDSVTARERAAHYAEEIVGDTEAPEEEIADAWADIIVFAIGALKKQGYEPAAIMEEVCKEINSRTGELVDGKFVKDPNAILYQANLKGCKCKK